MPFFGRATADGIMAPHRSARRRGGRCLGRAGRVGRSPSLAPLEMAAWGPPGFVSLGIGSARAARPALVIRQGLGLLRERRDRAGGLRRLLGRPVVGRALRARRAACEQGARGGCPCSSVSCRVQLTRDVPEAAISALFATLKPCGTTECDPGRCDPDRYGVTGSRSTDSRVATRGSSRA